jgi:hypothetical protein
MRGPAVLVGLPVHRHPDVREDRVRLGPVQPFDEREVAALDGGEHLVGGHQVRGVREEDRLHAVPVLGVAFGCDLAQLGDQFAGGRGVRLADPRAGFEPVPAFDGLLGADRLRRLHVVGGEPGGGRRPAGRVGRRLRRPPGEPADHQDHQEQAGGRDPAPHRSGICAPTEGPGRPLTTTGEHSGNPKP